VANRPSRIVVPVRAASYDGRYWGRYPNGDKPNSGAVLQADAQGRVGAGGQLSTAIRLGAGAQDVASGGAGMNSGIRLGATAQDVASATGNFGGFTPPGSVFYTSDFNSATDGADVSGTVMNFGAIDGPMRYSADFSRSNQGTGKSIKFPFGPLPPGQTYGLAFDFGAQYREVTFQYWLRYPSGYRHVDSPSSDNDKFFRIHQRTGGANPIDAPGYDTGEKMGCSTELAARGDTQYCDLASEWDIGTDGQGFTARSGLSGTLAVACSDFITPADFDVWTKIMWYVKAPTAKGTGRAILKLWKNDVLMINEQPDIYTVGEDHSYGKGYLFSTRNTADAPAGPTYNLYLDDLTVWVNP
jgi:hypothetical protein